MRFIVISSLLIFGFICVSPSLGSADDLTDGVGFDGFEVGNTFESSRLSGVVHMQCHDPIDGFSAASYRCFGATLTPATSSRFVVTGSGSIDGDQITLVATHEDGSTFSKTSRWDASKQASVSRFNLWLRTLTQIPLLESGRNMIQYRITKGSRVTRSGSFEALVQNGKNMSCPTHHIHSTKSEDCRFEGQACYLYFDEVTDCR